MRLNRNLTMTEIDNAITKSAKHDCTRDGHDWQPSGMVLLKKEYGGNKYVKAGPEVKTCTHCGLLRLPRKETT